MWIFRASLATLAALLVSEITAKPTTSPSALSPALFNYRSYEELVASGEWAQLKTGSPGGDLTRHITIQQDGLPEIKRMYIIHVPDAYTRAARDNLSGARGKKFPVLWYFHGQGMNPTLSIQETDYIQVADNHDYFAVFPKGVGKQDGGVEGTGWNVGSAGDDSVCTREAWSEFGCNCTSCYNSCESLGFCNSTDPSKLNKCGWSTCYDDVAFVKAIIEDIRENFAVDETKMFLSGCSNGGMMIQHLIGETPLLWRAVIPNYALPLKGYLKIPREHKVPFMSIYDRWDYTIPLRGGLSTEGWKYEPLEDVMEAWGQLHECNTTSVVPWTTPHDGGPRIFECFTYKGCKTFAKQPSEAVRTVVQCLWDGYHGDWPADGLIAKMTFWWIKRHVLLEEDEDTQLEVVKGTPTEMRNKTTNATCPRRKRVALAHL